MDELSKCDHCGTLANLYALPIYKVSGLKRTTSRNLCLKCFEREQEAD